MPSLLIFVEKTSPRLHYVCKLIFTTHLGIGYQITIDEEEFLTYTGPRLFYGKQASGAKIQIEPHTLLFETGIEPKTIATCLYKGVTVPFANNSQPLPFDLFSAIFYLVSRYEEYLPFEPNQYGQFKATDSLAHQSGFLHIPVVDAWILDLKEILLKEYPTMVFKTRLMKRISTYDIDVAYAYLGRSLGITLGNLLLDIVSLNIKRIKERLLVILKKDNDPFDTYDYLLEQKAKNNHELIFFFLLGKRNKFNHNINPSKRILQSLLKKLSKTEVIGTHPSYYADTDSLLLRTEKQLLEDLCNKSINISRQHYLRLSLPGTYENLIENNITADYTMGFAELPGFRAGTCTPFYFYNLAKDTTTDLMIYPSTFMDATFIYDLKTSEEHTLKVMKQLIDEIKKVNGCFIPIWHNNHLSNRGKWASVRDIHGSIAMYTNESGNINK
jgi:hypothetical protein